jgi:phosphate transport system substrate-binding protein
MRTRSSALAAALVVMAACSGKKDPAARGDRVTLNGSGATFQKAAQEIAIEAFAEVHPNIRVNYGAGGSGKGRQDFADGVVDYACTDAPYKPADREKVKGGEFFYIPNVLGAIAVGYRLPGVDKLQLAPETIAKIFQREIRRWDDPAIAADNPGVTLPALDIVVARRSDGSGTTENFTRYLHQAAPASWKLGSGATVEWPRDTQAGNGNGGVAQIVKSTKGAIGYIDLSDAKGSKLAYAAIRNRAGVYVVPEAPSVTAAGAGIEVSDELLFSALDASGEAAYPITAQSWCMVRAKHADAAKADALRSYFRFLVTDAQELLPEIDFAPIPEGLRARALARIDQIQGPG